MPLQNGISREVVGRNIRELQESGRPHEQAVAISLNQARKSGAKIPSPKKLQPYGKRA